MKRSRFLSLAFVPAMVLGLALAAGALAVPPRDGSGTRDPDKPNPIAVKDLQRGVRPGTAAVDGAGRRIGGPRVDRILTILVEFAGTDRIEGTTYTGPLHNRIPKPARSDNVSYWIRDFSAAHYRSMLFGTKAGARTMSTYFLQQSGRSYTVDGQVYGWVKVPHSEAYYGLNDGARVPELVRSAVQILGSTVPWADYDEDGDGVVDHVQFVHAGAEVAGSWTIWAHSSTVDPPAQTSDPGVVVGPYTINPEDGTIGVFCHEFGHNLGLPDIYDTIYSGQASTGYWALMSFGSWVGAKGEAVGTAPPSLGPWERETLGFSKPVVVGAGQPKTTVKLAPAARTGSGATSIRIDLPDYEWTLQLNTPHQGTKEWWSDRGDMMTSTLTRDVTLPAGSLLTFWTWWDIEPGWDYGYVEVLPAGSATWETVKGNITTDDDPQFQNDGNGITGPSVWSKGNVDGWVPATFDLSKYTGAVKLRFRYTTDTAVAGNGWTWDDLTIRAGDLTVFQDSAESVTPGWTANGWQLTAGSIPNTAENFYMIEWRDPTGFDVGMLNWPDFLNDTRAQYFKAYPGMLLWYYTDQFSDNWEGIHPWQGMLQAVDARPRRIPAAGTSALAQRYFGVSEGLPAPSNFGIADATFNKGRQAKQVLARTYGTTPARITVPAAARVAVFDDAKSWVDRFWEPYLTWDPDVWPAMYTSHEGWLNDSFNSVAVPTRGVRISVAPRLGKYAGGLVTVDYSRPVE